MCDNIVYAENFTNRVTLLTHKACVSMVGGGVCGRSQNMRLQGFSSNIESWYYPTWSVASYSKQKHGSKNYSACSIEGILKKISVEERCLLRRLLKSLEI